MAAEETQASRCKDRLDEMITRYLEAVAGGTAPDRREMLARHPDLAADLAAFFADHDRMLQLVGPRPPAADAMLRPATGGGDSPRAAWRVEDPTPVDQFVRQLVHSTLMSADEVTALIDSLPTHKKPQDGEQLARELVRQKKLTAYQVQQISGGKGNSLVLGNYVILDRLGQGGMGLVLKAEHRRMERLVALKVLPPETVQTTEAVRRFQREVKAAARLTHPNIVTAYDADEAGGTHFLVMEYVDGVDLASLVTQRGPLPLNQALDCVLQAARGLEYAHQHGVVHRDIKPANLLRGREGTVKVLDVGLARLDSADGDQDQLTDADQILGTVDYMAPEQAIAARRVDQRADIYSLGVTLWYLLTGRHLYAGETAVEKLMAHQTKPVPCLRSVCPGAAPKLEAAFAKMVAKAPEDRYQTMSEVIADLTSCGSGVASKEVRRRQWWQDWRKRVAVGVGVVLLGVWVIVHEKGGREVARVRVPEGGSVRVETAESASASVAQATKPASARAWSLPPGCPPPAVAPFDAAKAREHQAAWAKYLDVPVEIENSIGMRLVLIPPGESDMGSTDSQVAALLAQAKAASQSNRYIERVPAEAPQHRVRITRPFWLGRHEVTRGQFRRFVEDRGYRTEAERDGKGGYGYVDGQWKQDPRMIWNRPPESEQADDHPVVNVSWNDVTAFCAWLSEKEGETSHVPTEAQWEYACRAGTTTMWYGGDDARALAEHAWTIANAEGKAHPVGQKSPNAWGLYDVHGNVWEWCQDWLGEHYYATSPTNDPLEASRGTRRVYRGGGWVGGAGYCRAALRCGDEPSTQVEYLGFRLARIVSAPPPSR